MHYKIFILNLITPITRRCGFDLISYKPASHPTLRRRAIIRELKPDVVLDVGANVGQFGRRLRQGGFTGRIISFEPMAKAFEKLSRVSDSDPLWEVHNFGLGREKATAEIHVTANSASSSLLEMMPRHSDACPSSRVVGGEEVKINALNDLVAGLSLEGKRVYVKIDTQGFEMQVLQGATKILDQVVGMEVEVSLAELYKGQPEFSDVYEFLKGKGFAPVAFQPAFCDAKTGFMLQVDAFFVRSQAL